MWLYNNTCIYIYIYIHKYIYTYSSYLKRSDRPEGLVWGATSGQSKSTSQILNDPDKKILYDTGGMEVHGCMPPLLSNCFGRFLKNYSLQMGKVFCEPFRNDAALDAKRQLCWWFHLNKRVCEAITKHLIKRLTTFIQLQLWCRQAVKKAEKGEIEKGRGSVLTAAHGSLHFHKLLQARFGYSKTLQRSTKLLQPGEAWLHYTWFKMYTVITWNTYFFFVCEPHHRRLLCEGRKKCINIDPIPPPDRRRCQSESCRSGTQGVGWDGLS